MTINRLRGQFKLRDLLFAFAGFGLLFATIVPAVRQSRQHAAREQCANGLRSIGVALQVHVSKDPRGRFCTGAPDVQYDGPLDTVGWLADVRTIGGVSRSDLVCATSPVRGLESHLTVAKSDGIIALNRLVKSGHVTNYTASWHLVRGEPKFRRLYRPPEWSEQQRDANGFLSLLAGAPTGGDFRDQREWLGPLTTRRVEASYVPRGKIALLGDGAAAMSFQMRDGGSQDPGAIRDGDSLALGFAQGPGRIVDDEWTPLRRDDELNPQFAWEHGRRYDFGAVPDGFIPFVQNMRAFGAPHRVDRDGFCNMLMADGAVKQFTDRDSDRRMPQVPLYYSRDGAMSNAGVGTTLEMHSREIYNGVWLRFVFKGGPE